MLEDSLLEKGGIALLEKATVMEGRTYSKELRARLKTEVAEFNAQEGYAPGLAVVLVGDDPGSIAYSRTLTKTATDLGFYATNQVYPSSTTVAGLKEILAGLNADPRIHGITVQWPTPPHISLEDITSALDPRKDVDGYHPLSLGRLYSGMETFVPATPLGGMKLLEYYGFSVYGKSCLIVGNGVTVGRPLLALVLAAGGSPLVATILTPREMLRQYAAQADFIFLAAGSPGLLLGDMVKPGVVVVDFGTSQVGDKLVGDAAYENLLPVARAITPTPGGTGPMTNVVLLNNVLQAARKQKGELC